jgi:hypothetical protein
MTTGNSRDEKCREQRNLGAELREGKQDGKW